MSEPEEEPEQNSKGEVGGTEGIMDGVADIDTATLQENAEQARRAQEAAAGAIGDASAAIGDAADQMHWRDSSGGGGGADMSGAADAARQGADAAMAAGQQGADYVAANAPGAAAKAGELAGQGADAAMAVGQQGADYVAANAPGAAAKAGDYANDEVPGATDKAGQLVGQAGDAASQAAAKAGELAGQAGELAGDAADKAGELAGQAGELAGDAASEVAARAPGAIAQAGEYADQAGELAGQGADAAMGAAQQGAGAATDAYNSETGQAIVAGAGKAAGVAADGAEQGAEMAGDAASAAYAAAPGIAEDTADILKEGFGTVEAAYTMSADEAKKGMQMAAGLISGGCAALVPLIRIEIFRDFTQVMSVVFASAFAGAEGVAAAAARSFGAFYNFLAADFGNAFRSKEAVIFGIVVVVFLAVAALVGYLWMIFFSGIFKMAAEDEVRMGNEARSFAEMAKEKSNTVWMVGQILTLSTSVYLPVATVVFQILFCDKTSIINAKANPQCDNSGMFFLAGFLLVFFIMALPATCYWCIEKFKPTGSPENPEITFDQDGEKVPFDDKVYNELVENSLDQQLQPFRSLYRGFERKASSYKVGIMVFKCGVVFMTVVLSANMSTPTGAAVFQFVILLIQLLLMAYYMPFISPTDDFMDVQGRFCGTFIALGGVITAASKPGGGVDFMGVLVILANIYNTLSMGAIMLYSFQSVRNFFKDTTGRFSFSDTSRNMQDLPAIDAIANWNAEKEIKHRVWQTWWNGVLLNKCGEEVPGRLVKLQKDTVDNGLESIKNHWDGQKIERVRDERLAARLEHEGVDCYWNGAVRDGHLDTKTFFGKMYVKAYPFHMVLVYDDCPDESFIKDNEQLHEFITIQNSDSIQSKKDIRKKLRAISAAACKIHWPFSRMETHHHIEDGFHYENVPDGDGKTRREKVTDYSDINIEMHYTNGVISIGAENDKVQAQGFNFDMAYNDGYGHAIKPKTGESYDPKNRGANMPGSHVGLNDAFEHTPQLDKLFGMDVCTNAVAQHVPEIEEATKGYREGLVQKDKEANAVLGDGFWYFVYNQPTLPRDDLIHYLSNTESNTILCELPANNTDGMSYLYKRLSIIRSGGFKTAFWFVFWEDFWLNNKEMEIVALHADSFDPINTTAMCYNYKEREELEEILRGWGLITEVDPDSVVTQYFPCFQKQYFAPDILDALYDRLGGKVLPPKRSSIPGLTPHGLDGLAQQEET